MIGHWAEALCYGVFLVMVAAVISRQVRSYTAMLCGILALGAGIGGHFHHGYYAAALAAVVLGFLFSLLCVVLMYLSVQRVTLLKWAQDALRREEDSPASGAV